MSEPLWTDVLTAIFMPVIAALAALIAFLQWWTNHQRLKLDLFSKRYSVYEATMDLMRAVFQHGYATDKEIFEFVSRTSQSTFVLNEQISTHLSNVADKALELNGLREELETLPTGPDRSAKVAKQREIKNWIINQRVVLTDKFTNFLKIQRWPWDR